MAFYCPRCDGKTTVTETRAELRQRKCLGCGHKFFTEETELDRPPSSQQWGEALKIKISRFKCYDNA